MAIIPPAQRMFHGEISAAALADQLAARFNDRQRRVSVSQAGVSSLVQIGSKHGTPVTVHITDTSGGVLVTMSRDRNWLDKAGDASELIERAASNPLSLLAMVPDVLGELNQENVAPQIWDAINDLCALTRALAGERDAPQNPKVCEYCETANDPQFESCVMCGAALPSNLPRKCPKCGRGHTSDALFCQACGTRLVDG
ncbi:MAG: zinc ribbon domain-containing protein [Anaerolineae bacterium]|nr:zinc ribbon domain-containing protein [Anaerolineae bacterium]